ncbi:S41 family peptidase [Sedimentibacter sp. zth1]|uniref:S41 family peptidase n=1 Tax=Sedimentibacter sp. zth1 TaxID=2816908 RepID=UPI001A939A63|nr:S41 family peptidase [Sedimentibacter sp. zth1]QSX07066.1 S41 family peptidase [Sedimentibacter sp. zth1]
MISRKKFILSIVVAILLTAFVTFTFGNYALVEAGGKVLVSNDDFNFMKSFVAKYGQFESLINYAENNFLYEVDQSEMLSGGLKGMLNALDDPYTEYMSKEEYKSLMEHTAGSFDGIGVYIAPSIDNKIMVIAPIEDTPAEKAGLKSGDYIIKINGEEYPADKMDVAVKVMKGAPNTSVKITILRIDGDGKQNVFDVDIVREKIRIVSVKSQMLPDQIGYIRITTFDSETAADFKTQYNELKKEGMKGIIVDLRGNPGGLIDTSVEITDMFMGEGFVTYTKTKAGEKEYYPSDKDKIDIPLVMLVDGGSASASEIMSGAVKDTKSGTLIGTKTFGKGIVQRISRFGDDGAGVKMTISEYFTPSGVNIHGIGIEPDLVVELPEDIKGIGVDYLDTDNQLQKGIEVIKEKLVQ